MNSETAFIAKRRAAAKSAASKLPTAVKLGDGPTSAAQRGADWSASHNKELQFQRQKAQTKAVDALGENTLLKHGVTPALKRSLLAKCTKRAKGLRARERKTARGQAALTATSGSCVLRSLRGENVRSKPLAAALARHGILPGLSHTASVFGVSARPRKYACDRCFGGSGCLPDKPWSAALRWGRGGRSQNAASVSHQKNCIRKPWRCC